MQSVLSQVKSNMDIIQIQNYTFNNLETSANISLIFYQLFLTWTKNLTQNFDLYKNYDCVNTKKHKMQFLSFNGEEFEDFYSVINEKITKLKYNGRSGKTRVQ